MYYWHFQVFPLNVYFISVNISILKFSYCSFHELLIEKKKKEFSSLFVSRSKANHHFFMHFAY